MFSDFSFKFSHYTVLEAKWVENWKSEIHWWAHHPVRETKLKNFAWYRPWSLGMRSLNTPQWSACRQIEVGWRFSPSVDQWKRVAGSLNARLSTNRSRPNILAIFSRKTVDGGCGVCIMHAPHYQYRLSINRRVWGFGLMFQWTSTLSFISPPLRAT